MDRQGSRFWANLDCLQKNYNIFGNVKQEIFKTQLNVEYIILIFYIAID